MIGNIFPARKLLKTKTFFTNMMGGCNFFSCRTDRICNLRVAFNVVIAVINKYGKRQQEYCDYEWYCESEN